MELLLASSIGVIVLLTLSRLDVVRVGVTQNIATRMARSSEASFALVAMLRSLERADRVNIVNINPGNIQIRFFQSGTNDPSTCPNPSCTGTIPLPCCYDIPANYRWVQYRLVTAPPPISEIRYYDNTVPGCTAGGTSKFLDITGLTVQYFDETAGLPPPPGGEPPVQDNNIVRVTVQWLDPQSNATLSTDGEVTLRGVTYTNMSATPQDSGTGLSSPGVSNPPIPPCSN